MPRRPNPDPAAPPRRRPRQRRGRGRDRRRGPRRPRHRIPRAPRADLRRRGAPPVRQRLRQQRRHPLPRRPGHRRWPTRTRSASSRPSRAAELTVSIRPAADRAAIATSAGTPGAEMSARTRPARPLLRQVRFPALGEAGQRAADGEPGHALRLRRARDRAGQPPGPRRASGTSGSSTATSSRPTTSSARSSSTSRTSRDNLPKAEAAARKLRLINSTIDDRAGRHRHRPHQHPRPGRRRRPDPRRHRQLRDPLPDQRRRGQARQALDLRRRDRQRGADDDDHPGQDPLPALPDRDSPAARA